MSDDVERGKRIDLFATMGVRDLAILAANFEVEIIVLRADVAALLVRRYWCQCGDEIRPGVMSGDGCRLTTDGWECGECVRAIAAAEGMIPMCPDCHGPAGEPCTGTVVHDPVTLCPRCDR